jgi:hypothetical protein
MRMLLTQQIESNVLRSSHIFGSMVLPDAAFQSSLPGVEFILIRIYCTSHERRHHMRVNRPN